MTLYRQIATGIIVLLVLCFTGTVVLSTNNLRAFLESQMETHAQDTATSLGLSLSPHMLPVDMAIVESMVDAIYDRGYYSTIAITALDGKTLLERRSTVETDRAPAWFIDAIALQPPVAQALVMSGWKQTATVQVTSNPANAYSELWSNTVDTFWLFLSSAALLLALSLLAVKILLKPLKSVEDQAEAICNKSYPIQKALPRTRELRRVVLAMNHLSEKLEEIFTEQAEFTERLRKQAYMDPVTGIGNRRYFTRLLGTRLESPEDGTHGALLILEVNQLDRVNKTSGYTTGNALLARTAELISARLDLHEDCIATRIKGAEFAIVATGASKSETETLAEVLCHDLLQLWSDGLVEVDNIVHIGIALWKQGDILSELLSEADVALSTAKSRMQNSWHLYVPPASEQSGIHGEEHWHDFLKQIVDSGQISLVAQPVQVLGNNAPTLLHKEVLLRIADKDGIPIPAGIFMPMAERVGLASNIDRLAIEKLLNIMESEAETATSYAVNIASTSLRSPPFKEWLYSKLHSKPAIARRLLIEFSEYSALVSLQDTASFIEQLGTLGCRCGIDQFGRGFYSFGYLRSIKVSYLKVDSSYTRRIDQEEDNQFFIRALTDTAHSIDIKVIAQSVETAEECSIFESLRLDGTQGHLSGKPEPLG